MRRPAFVKSLSRGKQLPDGATETGTGGSNTANSAVMGEAVGWQLRQKLAACLRAFQVSEISIEMALRACYRMAYRPRLQFLTNNNVTEQHRGDQSAWGPSGWGHPTGLSIVLLVLYAFK